VLVGATLEETESMTDAMASFHAAFWDRADDAAIAALRVWGADAERHVARTRELLPRFPRRLGGTTSAPELAVAAELPERVAHAYASLARETPTLVHSDLHLDNVLFEPGVLPVILDWTDIARGPAVVDFARLLVEGITPDARRANQHALCVRYANALAARGVAGYGADRVRRDIAHVAMVSFAAMARWATGPDRTAFDVPRVPAIVEYVTRGVASAATEWAS